MTENVVKALSYADRFGMIDGAHHKQWVIDQMVRALMGCPDEDSVAIDAYGNEYAYTRQGTNEAYEHWASPHAGYDPWDEGIAP